ncbi:MAG: Sua5/YciO/YrdC/YwlC family protein [Alphaproteobacteria bacterium]
MGDESPLFAWHWELEGILQGVGFRPALYRLATSLELGGWVENHCGNVRLTVIGPDSALLRFQSSLPDHLPVHARLDRVNAGEKIPVQGPAGSFVIRDSREDDPVRITIPTDLAVCPECRREVLDPADRRHGYPFTSCPQCGPRYTVLRRLPYDRDHTSLDRFPLCPACLAEYENPGNRRFHAESMACPQCGPRVEMRGPEGELLADQGWSGVRRSLMSGNIVALRGLGGFQLIVDSRHREALHRLRRVKQRPHKPLAVMARSLEVVRRFCHVGAEEEALLASASAPIVILEIRQEASGLGHALDLLTPDSPTLGVMLPTTPCHLLLFHPLPGDDLPPTDLLMVTSGNRGGEPICTDNEEALKHLRGLADRFILHDREIVRRNDDGVTVVREGHPQVWRRARGMVPTVLRAPRPLRRSVLAMGADLKNTVALGQGY